VGERGGAGLGVVAGIFFSITALQTGQRYLMFLSAALVGACLGFLPYNFRRGRAQVFLGDGGASFIGFTLAGLAVMGEWAAKNPVIALFTPTLILGVPLFDIAFVGAVRVATGRVHTVSEWLAYTGKDHIHHRFEALGLSQKQSVLLIFFIASTLGLSAIMLKDATPREAVIALVEGGPFDLQARTGLVLQVHDHTLFVARVLACGHAGGEPLMYFASQYHRPHRPHRSHPAQETS